MKVESFPGNTRHCNFQYFRVREGPNFFVSFYKNSSRGHQDPKDCWRVLGTAKFTDSGKALKEWCLEMFDSNLPKPEPVADTSFASEVLSEVEELENPCANTKMIT